MTPVCPSSRNPDGLRSDGPHFLPEALMRGEREDQMATRLVAELRYSEAAFLQRGRVILGSAPVDRPTSGPRDRATPDR